MTSVQARATTPAPSHCTLAQSRERAVAPRLIHNCAGGIDRRRSGRRSMTSVQARATTPAPSHCTLAQSRERASTGESPCRLHCTLAQSRERAVAPSFFKAAHLCRSALHSRAEPRACGGTLLIHNCAGGIDRRRFGRRSMTSAQARARALAGCTALSLRAASVQWHPRSAQPRPSAVRHCPLAQSRERAVGPARPELNLREQAASEPRDAEGFIRPRGRGSSTRLRWGPVGRRW